MTIPFPSDALSPERPLRDMLLVWSSLPPLNKQQSARQNVSDQMILLDGLISQCGADLKKSAFAEDWAFIWKLVSIPVPTTNETVVYYWFKCVSAVLKQGLDISFIRKPYIRVDSLQNCEDSYRMVDIYIIISRVCAARKIPARRSKRIFVSVSMSTLRELRERSRKRKSRKTSADRICGLGIKNY